MCLHSLEDSVNKAELYIIHVFGSTTGQLDFQFPIIYGYIKSQELSYLGIPWVTMLTTSFSIHPILFIFFTFYGQMDQTLTIIYILSFNKFTNLKNTS